MTTNATALVPLAGVSEGGPDFVAARRPDGCACTGGQGRQRIAALSVWAALIAKTAIVSGPPTRTSGVRGVSPREGAGCAPDTLAVFAIGRASGGVRGAYPGTT